ncbi:tRNA-glutamine synthetase family protein [Striga asiatica]|uniref:tRNA-glutamine synthetase family protein n=1 Tax=Striga asiatica TaxID=4170 RepID=A0A5A7PXP3_STRAF|nr:tRNA-glutamine synthetase family protein [Striga asiatica]
MFLTVNLDGRTAKNTVANSKVTANLTAVIHEVCISYCLSIMSILRCNPYEYFHHQWRKVSVIGIVVGALIDVCVEVCEFSPLETKLLALSGAYVVQQLRRMVVIVVLVKVAGTLFLEEKLQLGIRRRWWSTGKKSVSAGGNSKRWRFKVKDLVRRSQSKGSKGSIVLLTYETKVVRETPAGGCDVIAAPRPRGIIAWRREAVV